MQATTDPAASGAAEPEPPLRQDVPPHRHWAPVVAGSMGRGCLRCLHLLAHLAIGAAVLVAVLLAGAAWRLSQGPIDLAWLTARLEAAVNQPDAPTRLRIGGTALAWEGFRLGVDRPLDLRLTDIALADDSGHQRMAIPQAELTLSLGALLLGRLQPRAVELDAPRLLLRRAADGTLSLDIGSTAEGTDQAPTEDSNKLPALLAELARPPTNDRTALRGWLSQIRRVRIRDGSVTVQDRQLGATWRAPAAEIDLRRSSNGGVSGTADLTLALGDQRARLTAVAELAAAATQTHLVVRLSPVTPAALAQNAKALAPLAMLDAPVDADADLTLDSALTLQRFRATAHAGAGTARIQATTLPIVGATLVAEGTPDAVRIAHAELAVRAHAAGPVTTLQGSGNLRRGDGQIQAALAVDLDAVSFADLPLLWPVGLGGGGRAWVVENIANGTARNGHVAVRLTASEDLSRLELTDASGTLDADGLTVQWLRPVPPVEGGEAHLRIVDPDALEITIQGGRQKLRGGTGALTVKSGTMRITGLMQHTQIASIEVEAGGSLPDALALLREPRLGLLDKHPMQLANPAGEVAATLTVRLPLNANVTMDDVAVTAHAQLTGVHLDAVAAGRDLDRGRLEMDATNDGLTLKGQAALAGIAAQLDASMDFRAGPPTQVVQRVTASGRPDARQLAGAGLDATSLVSGPVPLQVVLTEQRNGVGALELQADLTPTTLSVEPLAWSKPAGTAANGSARVRLVHDRLDGIDRITLDGEGLSVKGTVEATGGQLSLLRLDRVALGRSSLQGTVRLPAKATLTAPIVVSLSGPVLDLAPRLTRPHTPTPATRGEPPPGPPWLLDARFDRVLMASGLYLAPVTVHAENDGRLLRRLAVSGFTGPNAPFALHIEPQGRGRRLTATAAQAGDLLRAADWLSTMQEGKLSVTGTYDDTQPGHPLSGTAELNDFRVKQAAGLGKLLQAMTLYGLVDVLRGPGLAFTRLIAPFRLTDHALELSEARAFSPSLGLTAKGVVDLDAEQVDMQGTIVPAYFFNSLLGHVPLIGRLLSPERGGGVFAASYTLRGKLDDPDVSVNPLSALTPGFLRGLFKLF